MSPIHAEVAKDKFNFYKLNNLGGEGSFVKVNQIELSEGLKIRVGV